MGDIVISPAALVAITGLLSCLAGVVGFLYRAMIAQYEARLKEHKDALTAQDGRLKELAVSLNDLTTVVRSWMPEKQQQQVRRAVRD